MKLLTSYLVISGHLVHPLRLEKPGSLAPITKGSITARLKDQRKNASRHVSVPRLDLDPGGPTLTSAASRMVLRAWLSKRQRFWARGQSPPQFGASACHMT